MTVEHDAIEVRGDEEQVTSPSDVQPTLPHKLRKQADQLVNGIIDMELTTSGIDTECVIREERRIHRT